VYSRGSGGDINNPYDYRYDQNVDWTASNLGWWSQCLSKDQVRIYIYRGFGNRYGMVDIYVLEDIPGL
jgi:hypothetical protein